MFIKMIKPHLGLCRFQWDLTNNNQIGLIKVSLVENPPFSTKSFQLHDICNYVSIEFNFKKIQLWKLLIKLTCLLYWYIVESIFQLGCHLTNILDIKNVSKFKFQLCW
jgi:hypothetical protein